MNLDLSPIELATGEPQRFDDPVADAVEQDMRENQMLPAVTWVDIPPPQPILRESKCNLSRHGGFGDFGIDFLSIQEDGSGKCWCYITTNGVSWGVYVEGRIEEVKALAIHALAERFEKAANTVAELRRMIGR
jgi:hypothetical protein